MKTMNKTSLIKTQNIETLIKKSLVFLTNNQVTDNAYQEKLESLILRKEMVKKYNHTYPITYTPLQGVGIDMAEKTFKHFGFLFSIVKNQAQPDPSFSSVTTPNPENPQAFDQALIIAKTEKSQLIIATDPDADRLGIFVNHNNEYIYLDGDKIGTLLLEYLISRHIIYNTMPKNPYFINTIVSSQLCNKISQFYGLKSYQVLTGFKHIAERIQILEEKHPQESCIFAYEESHGFLVNPHHVRDKDGISSALLIAECGLWNYQQKISLIDRLNNIYNQFGYFLKKQINKHFYGIKGMQTIKSLMEEFRCGNLKWCRKKTKKITDYLNTYSGYRGKWDQEIYTYSSNVLEFNLEDNYTVYVRPSGTEPKIKFYILGEGKDPQNIEKGIQEIVADLEKLLF